MTYKSTHAAEDCRLMEKRRSILLSRQRKLKHYAPQAKAKCLYMQASQAVNRRYLMAIDKCLRLAESLTTQF
jgi:hypothetical protein